MHIRLTHLTDAQLIRYWRLAYKMLDRFQSKRAFRRLYFIVNELDRRGM